MLTPEEPVKLHRICNDQLYHYYLGDPIEVLMLPENGSAERHIVGPDLRQGHRVQLYIPGSPFHTARVIGGRRWFLGASTEWPGVEPADSSSVTRMCWQPSIQASLPRSGASRC